MGARKSDSKTCVCKGKNQETYNLQVFEPKAPRILYTNIKLPKVVFETKVTAATNLTCHINGLPEPIITWHRNGKELHDNNKYTFIDHNRTLQINTLIPVDTAVYKCCGKNIIGSVEWQQETIVLNSLSDKLIFVCLGGTFISILCCIIIFSVHKKHFKKQILRDALLHAAFLHPIQENVQHLNPFLSIDFQADLLPYDLKFEFPRNKLKLGKRLGSGAFGIVVMGQAFGIKNYDKVTTVAVKMVKRSADIDSIRDLAKELKIMIYLGNHPNIVNLLGACTKNIIKCELLVMVEYCRYGNLRDYMLRNRSNFLNQIDSKAGKFDFSTKENNLEDIDKNSCCINTSDDRSIQNNAFSNETETNSDHLQSGNCALQPSTITKKNFVDKSKRCKSISFEDLLYWSHQIACGMDFLSQKKVLHGDLGARNVLLADDNTVKICDFGLSKSLYNDSKYKKEGRGLVPVKWMAVECFRDQIFSIQSDVWAFGVVMWELFTLADTPYPGTDAERQFIKLCEGYRLEQPQYATNRVYEIMFQCWRENPAKRLTFFCYAC